MACGGALPAHRLRDHRREKSPAPSLRTVKSCSGAVRRFKSSQVKSSANNRGTLVRRGRRELSSPALPATKSLISRTDTSPEILPVCRLVSLETSFFPVRAGKKNLKTRQAKLCEDAASCLHSAQHSAPPVV